MFVYKYACSVQWDCIGGAVERKIPVFNFQLKKFVFFSTNV